MKNKVVVLAVIFVAFLMVISVFPANGNNYNNEKPQISINNTLPVSTVYINGSNSYIPFNSKYIGPVNPLLNTTIYLGLNTVNNTELNQFIKLVSTPGSEVYGHYLSPEQFENMFEPSKNVYDNISNYYKSEGFKIIPTGGRLSIGLEGNFYTIDNVFNANILLYNTSLGTYYFNTKNISIPQEFSNVINTAIGFSNYPYFEPQLLVNPASGDNVSEALNATNNGAGGQIPQPPYTPYALYKAYDELSLLNSGYQGQYETIAVTDAYGDPTASADLAEYDLLYNVSTPPSFTVIYPYGQSILGTVTNDACAVEQLWEVESAVDIEMSHAFAPQANIVDVVSPDADYTLTQSLVYTIENHLANVISNSWGAAEPEVGPCIDYTHPFFKMAAATGITLLAASGDNGSAGYDSSVPRSVNWPADDPYVTAVGGTTIFMNGTISTVNNTLNGPPSVKEVFNPIAMVNETAWDGYSGGGYSVVFPRPYWQHGYGLPSTGKYADRRGVPDVAANAMFGGNDFVFNGLTAGSFLFGGTSFASPTWAGIVATMDSYITSIQGVQLGYLNPALYNILNSPVYNESFYNVKYGYNGPDGYFNAHAGWNPVTGLGSPETAFLAKELAEYTFESGAYGDYNTTNNTGISANIETVLPDRSVGTSTNYFYIYEKLSSNTELMLGYAVNNEYPDGTLFYGIVPSDSLYETSFINCLNEVPGNNGEFNNYTIIETSPGVWAFEINSNIIAEYSSASTSSGMNSPEYIVSAMGVTSDYNTLGPVIFNNMKYVKNGEFNSIESLKGLEKTNIYSSYKPPYYFKNPYGVEYIGNNSIKAGSNIPYNNTTLFGIFYSIPAETVFLKYPQDVSLYAQHVDSMATDGDTTFPLSTEFPTGQKDFDSSYTVPVLGPDSWNFVLNQSIDSPLYISQVNYSYVHFYLSLESLLNSNSIKLGVVPVTVSVSISAGSLFIGTATETLNISLTGGVAEYNLSFISQVRKIPENSYISMDVSWYVVSVSGENIQYGVVLHSGQDYPISLTLPVYNPVDVSPLMVSSNNSYINISSTIKSPFGSYDLKNVTGYMQGSFNGIYGKLYPGYTLKGNTYVWSISTKSIGPGTYNFIVYAYDIQGRYNTNKTQFTILNTGPQAVAPPPAPPLPPAPPPPAPIRPP